MERVSLEPHAPDTPRATYSLADRFEMLLDVGRRIGTAVSPTAVYEEVYQAAMLMLRGDHCNVVRLGEGEDDVMVSDSGSMVPDVSLSLMRQAVDGLAPVVSSALSDTDTSDSMLLADLRSILCAPIISEGRVVACFNVTHHQVNDLFGDVEVQLAEFIATLAGAALERVAGSEAHFRSLAQKSSDVTTVIDRQGRITYQSSSVEEVFGFAPEEMVGRELTSWLHPEDAPQLLAYLDPGMHGEPEGGLVQARMRHRDGSWRVGESAVRSLFDDPSVDGLVLNTRDASDRVALEAELRDRASHDSLTGLANRSLFIDRVDEAFVRRQTHGHPLAVIFLDLDDFKSINDTLGHGVGDQLLELTSTRLEQCVRPGDTVARWGGDEFALLLENADAQAAEQIVKRIIAVLGHPYRINDQEILSRASVGVAVTGDGETAEDVLLGADVAMYVAKSRGKSRYQFFEADMRDAAVERAALRTDLEWALQRGELTVHYQPIVDLAGDGTLGGFEAVIRWCHPTRGELLPDQWIHLAEGSGMIIGIGRWVLRKACHQAAVWQRLHGQRLPMAVNVSARQLQDPSLVDEIAAALRESGLEAGALVLEITESATADDPEAAIAQLQDAARPGRRAVDRRLRDGLLVAQLPPPLPGATPEGGPLLRRRGRHEPRGPRHRVGHHQSRSLARAARDRGGRRDGRATRRATAHGLRPGPGVPLARSGRRGGRHQLAVVAATVAGKERWSSNRHTVVRSNEVQGRVTDDLRGAGRPLRRAGQGALERRADLLRHQ